MATVLRPSAAPLAHPAPITPPPLRATACAPASVSAVLPAYNEEAVIGTTLRRTHAALEAASVPSFEVIVVDDGSTDGTRMACEGVAAELATVRVLWHAANRGYGAALRTGFDAARGAAIFLMDSDGQFDPADIGRLLGRWDGASLICGYRARRNDPLVRRVNNGAFFAIVNVVFARSARDINCGFKLFPRSVGQGLCADGALLGTELVVRARDRGHRIVDVAVPHHPRLTGNPTGAKLSVVLRAFPELWRLSRRLRAARRLAQPSVLVDAQ